MLGEGQLLVLLATCRAGWSNGQRCMLCMIDSLRSNREKVLAGTHESPKQASSYTVLLFLCGRESDQTDSKQLPLTLDSFKRCHVVSSSVALFEWQTGLSLTQLFHSPRTHPQVRETPPAAGRIGQYFCLASHNNIYFANCRHGSVNNAHLQPPRRCHPKKLRPRAAGGRCLRPTRSTVRPSPWQPRVCGASCQTNQRKRVDSGPAGNRGAIATSHQYRPRDPNKRWKIFGTHKERHTQGCWG